MLKKVPQLLLAGFQAFLISCGSSSGKPDLDLIPVEAGNKYQYIDFDGKIVINPQFEDATLFRDGLALVHSIGDNPKWGYITPEGTYKINPTYKSATIFNEELAWVVLENAAPNSINREGEIQFALKNAEAVNLFSEGLAGFSIVEEGETKWGFVDTSGKVVINPQFKEIRMFSEGFCAVKNDDNLWGYIDRYGKIVINYQFDGVAGSFDGNGMGKFLNGRAIVKSGKQFCVINEEGRYEINPQFDEIIADGENYLIENDGVYGWCDSNGKLIINPQFDQAFPFGSNDYAPVEIGNKWGYINREGKIEINPQFKGALPYHNNRALVATGDKFGIIDSDGKYLVNPQFEGLARDVIIYLVTGDVTFSEHSEVNTDYFNISGIISRLNISNPEGMQLKSSLSELQDKFGIAEDEFSFYRNYHEIFDDLEITSEAELRFRVYYSKAYKQVQDGWYTKRVFNPETAIRAYEFYIDLKGRGRGKADAVAEALIEDLNGYIPDDERSTDSKKIFNKENHNLTVQHGNSYVRITVENNE
jgi:hypothetical protein